MAVRGLPRRFRFPWRTRFDIHRDIDDELAFHVEMREAELRRSGLEAEAARRETLRRFGDLASARRDLRSFDRRTETRRRRRLMWDELLMDGKSAWRALVKRPGFSAVAVLVLALGIGVNTAMFSLANVLLMKPLTIEKPEELVGLYNRDTEQGDRYRSFSYPAFSDIRQRSDAFSSLSAFTIATVGLTDGETTRRVMAGVVSEEYFDTYGVAPARGRGFNAEEARPGAEIPVAVASHSLWQRSGGGDEFLGSTIRVNGTQVTVVGITAENFTGSSALFSPELWFPLGLFEQVGQGPVNPDGRALMERDNYALMVFGRLRPGLSGDDVKPGLDRLAVQLEEEFPKTRQHQTLMVAPLPRLGISSSPRSEGSLFVPVLMLMCLSGVVLLIACLDLTNMFLARGESRRSEIAVRVALGGGRGRLVRQQLSEGFLLSLLGGAAGLLFAYWVVRLLVSSIGAAMPFDIAFVIDPMPDVRVAAAALAFCVFSTLLFAFVPAWRQTAGDVFEGLKDRSQSGSGPRGRRLSLRSALVISQVALSMVLLTAAGLFVRGSLAAAQATPGFSLENSLLVELDTSLLGYDETRGRQVYQQVTERLESLPGVENVGLASLVPFGSMTLGQAVRRTDAAADQAPLDVVEYVVNDAYFESLRLPILSGRAFDEMETWNSEGPRVVIVDQPLADKLWPGQDPVGRLLQTVTQPPAELPPAMEVVGVVPGVRHDFTDETPPPHVYLPFGQHWTPGMNLHLRLADGLGGVGAQAAMLQTVRQEIRTLDARLPVLSLRTMLDHRNDSLFMWLVRTGAQVFAALGALALFLALVGVYGVKAYIMARRTREIGVRLALGATPNGVMRQMVREGFALTLWGLGLGVLLAYGVARLIGNMLYEVHAGDPLVFGVAVTVLAVSAVVATWIPVRRACRIEPTMALRDE